jgi:membrane protein
MKKSFFRSLPGLLKTTFKRWNSHDPFREGAVIAYSAIFSLPGLLVMVITLVGYFFGTETVSGRLHQELAGAMGKNTADQIQQMIMAAMKTKDSIWATILGIAVIIIGAVGIFVEFQKTFNVIWEVKVVPYKSGIWKFIRTRLFSFGLVISIAFLLLISLVISSVISAMGNWIEKYWSESFLVILKALNFAFSLATISVVFALMFKFLPDAKIKWPSVWIGAITTSLLFVIGKAALGLYFGKAHPGSGYGAAGSVVLILLWASYSSMIVFFGAEFTKVYSDEFHGKTAPSEHAVSETEKEPAKEPAREHAREHARQNRL